MKKQIHKYKEQTNGYRWGEGRKTTYKNTSKAIKKMAVRTGMLIITLNVNVLNAPTKRH